MKIKFKKKRLRYNLNIGILMTCLGSAYFIFDASPMISGYLYLAAGLSMTFQYLYDVKHQYLIIENGIIKKNKLYSLKKKILIEDILEIKGTNKGYLLKSEKVNLKINPKVIDEESMPDLIQYLQSINIPDDKNLFSKFKFN
jgi:hypothetical protein